MGRVAPKEIQEIKFSNEKNSNEFQNPTHKVKNSASKKQNRLSVGSNARENRVIDGAPRSIPAPINLDQKSQHDHREGIAANGLGPLLTNRWGSAIVNGGAGPNECALTLAAHSGIVVVGVIAVGAVFHESGHP